MNQLPPVITIDGPSASGKSSVSRELAHRLGWKWVSTGAFYRGLAYVARREGVLKELSSPELLDKRITDLLTTIAAQGQGALWSVRMDADNTHVFYRQEDVSSEVFAEENGAWASLISQIPAVRHALLKNQRDCAVEVPGLVAEGRDCGTVVFPQARLKIFLTASQRERAARRAREQGLDPAETEKQQQVRDQQDANRAAAPMQVPAGAKVLDSNGMSLSEVVDTIYSWAKESI